MMIKVGDMVVATDPCTMSNGYGGDALVVGKKYIIDKILGHNRIEITSELGGGHQYTVDGKFVRMYTTKNIVGGGLL